jgi:hypothetical protein
MVPKSVSTKIVGRETAIVQRSTHSFSHRPLSMVEQVQMVFEEAEEGDHFVATSLLVEQE